MADQLQVSQLNTQIEYVPTSKLRIPQVEAQVEYQSTPKLRIFQALAQVEYGPSRVMVSSLLSQIEYTGGTNIHAYYGSSQIVGVYLGTTLIKNITLET